VNERKTVPTNDDYLIALSLLPFMSSGKLRRLLSCVSPIQRIADTDPDWLAAEISISKAESRLLRNPFVLPEIAQTTERLRSESIALGSIAYPLLLQEIHDPPPVLFFRGRIELLNTPSVAVVGSRRASEYGLRVTRNVTGALVEAGITVVSGLARGIDAEAHRTALSQAGNTIAVLGTGLDVIYPTAHRALFESLSTDGLVVTEFRRGTPARREHFPIRNRIISGLCSAVVVVEASARSGSLITARLAGEQGRDVLAVPGSIFSGTSEGTHRLIQDGAKLLHTLNDLFEELRIERLPPGSPPPPLPPLDPASARLIAALSRDEARHLDQIGASLGQTPGQLAEALLTLEMNGDIKDIGGGRYLRLRD